MSGFATMTYSRHGHEAFWTFLTGLMARNRFHAAFVVPLRAVAFQRSINFRKERLVATGRGGRRSPHETRRFGPRKERLPSAPPARWFWLRIRAAVVRLTCSHWTSLSCDCKQMKPLEDFHLRRRRGLEGRMDMCKACNSLRGKAYRAQHPDKKREYMLKYEYGISLERYQGLLQEQDGKCAICRMSTAKLGVDHDHMTGKVRGLLCFPCNSAIGLLKDDPEVTRAASEYLNRHRK